MSNDRYIKGCTCEGTIFTDKMCKPCLKDAEERLERRIETLEEKLYELEGDLDQVRTYLYDEEEESA